ncbi:uncharacterized protein LOC125576177 [Brassica napus]|uniref:uncharacterized protein LOC125576177 n=1 Tax=Brassica napus TaxID=3708 RepID=UPI0020787A85|nr:uncharacterized protein LOC125576177 [Brassica napus]
MEVFLKFRSLFVLQEPEEVVETESSDWWIDSESEKLLSRSMSNDSSKTWEDVSEDSVFEPYDPPYKRFPLTDNVFFSAWISTKPHSSFFLSFSESKSLYLILLLQINELAEKYAGLMTLKEYRYVSCKYPIYHIPTCKNDKDFDDRLAYFLILCLLLFKMQGDLWRKTGFDQDRLIYLQSAADSWLKQLSDDHHDNNFFINF